MSTFAVTYDLRRPGKDYSSLIRELEKYLGSIHYQQSCWFIRSAASAADVRDHLRQYIDANDLLMVMLVTSAAWSPTRSCDEKIKYAFAA